MQIAHLYVAMITELLRMRLNKAKDSQATELHLLSAAIAYSYSEWSQNKTFPLVSIVQATLPPKRML